MYHHPFTRQENMTLVLKKTSHQYIYEGNFTLIHASHKRKCHVQLSREVRAFNMIVCGFHCIKPLIGDES